MTLRARAPRRVWGVLEFNRRNFVMRSVLSLLPGIFVLTCWCSAQTVDVVGGTANSFVGNNLGRGNSYAVTASVSVLSIEAWLSFSGPRTLNFYVYQLPVEFGSYAQVHVNSVSVNGSGTPGWHSSGPINVPMSGGNHYLIAVSWTGQVSYAFSSGFSAPVSFGWQTHGYADGFHPLPASLSSTFDDSAIYHQRITTSAPVPGTPSATPVGAGCLGSTGGLLAVLRTDEVPALGNAGFNLVIDQVPVFGQGYLFVADALAPQPVPVPGGCLVYLDLVSVNAFLAAGFPLGPFPTSSVNITTVPLPVPTQLSLGGQHFFFQAAASDPGSPLGLVLTNVVDCLIN
jgi:hypothetical protein